VLITGRSVQEKTFQGLKNVESLRKIFKGLLKRVKTEEEESPLRKFKVRCLMDRLGELQVHAVSSMDIGAFKDLI